MGGPLDPMGLRCGGANQAGRALTVSKGRARRGPRSRVGGEQGETPSAGVRLLGLVVRSHLGGRFSPVAAPRPRLDHARERGQFGWRRAARLVSSIRPAARLAHLPRAHPRHRLGWSSAGPRARAARRGRGCGRVLDRSTWSATTAPHPSRPRSPTGSRPPDRLAYGGCWSTPRRARRGLRLAMMRTRAALAYTSAQHARSGPRRGRGMADARGRCGLQRAPAARPSSTGWRPRRAGRRAAGRRVHRARASTARLRRGRRRRRRAGRRRAPRSATFLGSPTPRAASRVGALATSARAQALPSSARALVAGPCSGAVRPRLRRGCGGDRLRAPLRPAPLDVASGIDDQRGAAQVGAWRSSGALASSATTSTRTASTAIGTAAHRVCASTSARSFTCARG